MTVLTPLPGMGQAVFDRTVARTKADGSKESWLDVAERMAYGNLLLDRRQARGSVLAEYVEMRNAIASGTLLMSGRHQQHGDAEQHRKPCELHTNCSTAATSFMSLMLLLSGCGVGRSYDDTMMVVNWNFMPNLTCVLSRAHPDYTGVFPTLEEVGGAEDKIYVRVEDSREGWARSLEILEGLTFERNFANEHLVLDFSDVRPKDAPIRGMQNRPASGPVPLMYAFLEAKKVKGKHMHAWEQNMRIDHAFAACVAVGGVRRAARIAIKHWRDNDILEFIDIKTHGGLWSANNSVGVDAEFWEDVKREDSWAQRVFNATTYAAYEHGTGEPGFLNIDRLNFVRGQDGFTDGDYVGNERYEVTKPGKRVLAAAAAAARKLKYPVIVNPCVTADTWVQTTEGPRQVKNLLDRPCSIVVHGKSATATQFWPTGIRRVNRVVTKRGYELRATRNHLVRLESGEWCAVSNLKPGDRLQLHRHHNLEWQGSGGTFEEGWLVGQVVGDGGFNADSYGAYVRHWGEHRHEMAQYAGAAIRTLPGTLRSDFGSGEGSNGIVTTRAAILTDLTGKYLESKTKELLPSVETASSDFYRGFLSGFFDTDGSPQGGLRKGRSVRLAQVSISKLKIVQRMLLRLGIASTIYTNRKQAGTSLLPDGKGGEREYPTQAVHELVISRENIDAFAERVHFRKPDKARRLESLLDTSRSAYRDSFTTTVVDVIPDGIEMVYDCKVFADHHSFDANGLVAHNCSEIPLSVLGGYCTLASCAPYFADTLEQATRAFELAARALVRVNLMPALYHREVARTNRIGVGFTGIFEFAWKFWQLSFRDLIADYDMLMSNGPEGARAYPFWEWMASARVATEAAADELSDALGVVRPHSVTMVAPTGTISKVFGLTEGAHLPAFREYLRWVQFQHGDPLIEEYRSKGYLVMDEVPTGTSDGYRDVSLVGFPTRMLIRTLGIPDEQFVTASEATMEEQFQWLTLLEKYWLGPRGNQVSYTMKYVRGQLSYQHYVALVSRWMPKVRCVSVLPTDAWETTVEKYGYAPEEPISAEAYARIESNIQRATEVVTHDELQCASGACPI